MILKPRIFTRNQAIAAPREEVFAFFATPANLEAITPPWLNFRMVDASTEEIRENSEFTYRLKVHGIPMTWVSRISEWVPGERFVDEQIRGPYAMWHHTHTFDDFGDGTLIGDRVRYSLPLAPLSGWIAGWFVDADVRKIFEYRSRRIEELLAPSSSGKTG